MAGEVKEPDDIFWVPMGGSCIKEASFDPYTLILWIRFVEGDGKAYMFRGFMKSRWDDFKKAPSKGKYYHKFIKGRYRA